MSPCDLICVVIFVMEDRARAAGLEEFGFGSGVEARERERLGLRPQKEPEGKGCRCPPPSPIPNVSNTPGVQVRLRNRVASAGHPPAPPWVCCRGGTGSLDV